MTQIAIALLTLLCMVGLEQEASRSTTYNEKTGQSMRPNNEETGGAATPQRNVTYDVKLVKGEGA